MTSRREKKRRRCFPSFLSSPSLEMQVTFVAQRPRRRASERRPLIVSRGKRQREDDQDSCLSSRGVKPSPGCVIDFPREVPPPSRKLLSPSPLLSSGGNFAAVVLLPSLLSLSIPGALLSSPLNFPARNDDGRSYSRNFGDGRERHEEGCAGGEQTRVFAGVSRRVWRRFRVLRRLPAHLATPCCRAGRRAGRTLPARTKSC